MNINLRRAADLLGLPVINLVSGEIIGEVEDLIFIPETKEIKGLIVQARNKYFVQIHNINNIGEDAVTVNHDQALQKYEYQSGMGVKTGANSIIGELVITKQGKEVGLINDVVIDEVNLKLIGYELSAGMLEDLVQGRDILSLDRPLSYGKDALIIEEEKGDQYG